MPEYRSLGEAIDAILDYFRGKGLKLDPKPTDFSDRLKSIEETKKRLDDWTSGGSDRFFNPPPGRIDY